EPHIATLDPARFRKPLPQGTLLGLSETVGCVATRQYPDPPHPPALLGARRKRPRRCRATKEDDELASPHCVVCHSITSSALASSGSGMVRPSALAVLRLTTRSYLVGSCTGRSPGFTPLRMRST